MANSERKQPEPTSDHIGRMARIYSPKHHSLREVLDKSLKPRGPEMLFDVAAEYLTSESLILDVGCRDASHVITLVQTHGCRGVGFDPVDWHLDRARAAVDESGLADKIEVTRGAMEQIEQPDDRFDFIWCRDVLELVEGLEQGLSEAARVLKPDGAMLIYTNFATDLLEPREAAMLLEPLGNVPSNFDEGLMEATFQRAGLIIDRKDVIGTEWREHQEEGGDPVSANLLRLARLRRRREEIIEEYGQERYDLAQASLQWMTYQFLGKLQPTMYVLKHAPDLTPPEGRAPETVSLDAESAAYADEVAHRLQTILGDDLVGVYLHGSAVLGDFSRTQSDIDIIAVAERSLSAEEKQTVAAKLSSASLPSPVRELEFHIIKRPARSEALDAPPFELHIAANRSGAADRVVDGLGHAGDSDLLMHFAVLAEHGYALLGPPASAIFPRIGRGQLIRAFTGELRWAITHASPSYQVLNAARAWRYLEDGEIVSKLEGGQWARDRVTDTSTVDAALQHRQGRSDAKPDVSQARAFVEDVLRHLSAAGQER